MTGARLPAASELTDFDFAASAINGPLIRGLAGGGFLEAKRNSVPVGGTGKTRLAVAIARSRIRKTAKSNGVDPRAWLKATLEAVAAGWGRRSKRFRSIPPANA